MTSQKLAEWGTYPNFPKHEFDCKHTGKNEMKHSFMARLQRLRDEFAKPMPISSGYRDKTHPAEARKGGSISGAHTTGRSCDVVVSRGDAYRLIELAIKHGFTGIGVQQKGGARFIHLDDMTSNEGFVRPTVWSY
jgi:uncharacterized protein YcbK (DUF882 family)